MNFILADVTQLCNKYFVFSGYFEADDFVDSVHEILIKYRRKIDKIEILTIAIERTVHKKQERPSIVYDKIIHLLNDDLEELGVVINQDIFTTEEKRQAENNINGLEKTIEELLKSNQLLKNEHEILFNELQELKKLFFLGKKNWYQLIIGKFSTMKEEKIISIETQEDFSRKLIPTTYNNYNIINHGSISTLNQGQNIENNI